MDRLTVLALAALAVVSCPSSPASAEPTSIVERRLDRWQHFITEAAARFEVPEAWIRAVMQAESGGRTTLDGRLITSRAGAMGLMQLMPGTYVEMRRRHGLGDDPHDPRDNIFAGTAYLRAMFERFGFPGFFAAYNAGPGRYRQHLTDGRPLPRETRAFLVTLDPPRLVATASCLVPSAQRLFFPLRRAGRGTPTPASGGLFVPLHAASGRTR
ncbi:MAG: lytic transglycosylase domain-containing protein [Gammaproteobacteria bacterium]|uniref:lytic transglycosylase domain-containing protein n=1 Tax=Thalassobaculum sp. TaxID=2022740 RepID=UPI0032EC4E4D